MSRELGLGLPRVQRFAMRRTNATTTSSITTAMRYLLLSAPMTLFNMWAGPFRRDNDGRSTPA